MTERNDRCPNGCDLRGPEIPLKHRHLYPQSSTHYSRLIGMELPGVHDGVAFWICPDCGEQWHRYPEGRVHDAVEEYWMQDPLYRLKKAVEDASEVENSLSNNPCKATSISQ